MFYNPLSSSPGDNSVFDPFWFLQEKIFVDVFVLCTPVWFLIISGIVTLVLLEKKEKKKKKTLPNEDPWTNFERFELLRTLGLSILPLVMIMTERPMAISSSSSETFSMIFTSFGWTLSGYFLYIAKRKQTFGPNFWCLPMFWILMLLANSYKLYFFFLLSDHHGLIAKDGGLFATILSWFIFFFFFFCFILGIIFFFLSL